MRTQYSVVEEGLMGSHLRLDRFIAIPGLLVTSLVCYTLLTLHLTGWRGSERDLAWTKANRTYITISIQILSHALGLIHVQVLCNMWRVSFVWSAVRRPFRLCKAQFISAASTPRMSWNLRWELVFLLLIWNVLILLPAAGWAGAITPLQSQQTSQRLIQIPTYEYVTFNLSDPSISSIKDGNLSAAYTVTGGRPKWRTNKGVFGFDDWATTRRGFLDSASDSSLIRIGYTEHAKLDKTGYSFVNRSNGVGSIAGLLEFNDTTPIWYSYTERAFSANVSCFFNESISWYWQQFNTRGLQTGLYGIVEADGDMRGSYPALAWLADDLLGWELRFVGLRGATIQMVSGANGTNGVKDSYGFQAFNHIQCDVVWDLADYVVKVNDSSRLIYNEPKDRGSLPWPDNGKAVAWQLYSDALLPQVYDLYMGGSEVGNALRMNLDTLQNATGIKDNASALRATEDFMSRILDQANVHLQTTRVISGATNATKLSIAEVTSPALVLGDLSFVIIMCVLNSLILLGYLYECWRYRGWHDMPPFDLSNTCDVVISALRGAVMHRTDVSNSTLEYDITPSTKFTLTCEAGKTALVPLLASGKENQDVISQSEYKNKALVNESQFETQEQSWV